MKQNLEIPSIDLVREKLEKIKDSKDEPRKTSREVNYPAIKNAERALKQLIDKFPNHESLEIVYLKVTAINSLYSTNIYDTYKIAYHIFENIKDIETLLKTGSPELVGKIAMGHGIKGTNGKEKNFYSFATKYCSFHNPKEYAIYDTLIQDLLIKFLGKNAKFSKLKERMIDYYSLRDYSFFMQVINMFKNEYGLEEFSLKEIDMYLWLLGKEIELETLKDKKDI